MYILYYVHDAYVVLYAYGALRVLDMHCCVQMMLCTCWICNVMYMWCCVHVVHVALCTYGVVCMIVKLVLCACGVIYMLYKWCFV